MFSIRSTAIERLNGPIEIIVFLRNWMSFFWRIICLQKEPLFTETVVK